MSGGGLAVRQAPAAGEFFGRALPLSPGDWRLAAHRLRVEPAAIRAVAQQESAGRRGFLPDKRPLILFEAHKFSFLTKNRFDRSHPNISSPSWNRALYKGGAGEYDRLAVAVHLDRVSALRAASWGMFQILGDNHASAGYGDVEAYVAAMCDSEGNHLQAFVTFVQKDSILLRALQRLDWARFAARYNGPSYRANQYDRHMALFYKRFRADTSWLGSAPQGGGRRP